MADAEPRFYMLSFNNGGLPGGKRHWITGGGDAHVVEKWVLTDFQNEVKGDPKLVRTMTVRGRRVSIYHFPPFPAGGPNGGHWAAFIRVSDEIVFASPHERRYVEAAIQMALTLAEQTDATRPVSSNVERVAPHHNLTMLARLSLVLAAQERITHSPHNGRACGNTSRDTSPQPPPSGGLQESKSASVRSSSSESERRVAYGGDGRRRGRNACGGAATACGRAAAGGWGKTLGFLG